MAARSQKMANEMSVRRRTMGIPATGIKNSTGRLSLQLNLIILQSIKSAPGGRRGGSRGHGVSEAKMCWFFPDWPPSQIGISSRSQWSLAHLPDDAAAQTFRCEESRRRTSPVNHGKNRTFFFARPSGGKPGG